VVKPADINCAALYKLLASINVHIFTKTGTISGILSANI